LSFAAARASISKRARASAWSEKRGLMNLMATRTPSATCAPSQTVPMPPLPMSRTTRYLPPTIDPASEGASLMVVASVMGRRTQA
jgi:hypothetical protein